MVHAVGFIATWNNVTSVTNAFAFASYSTLTSVVGAAAIQLSAPTTSVSVPPVRWLFSFLGEPALLC